MWYNYVSAHFIGHLMLTNLVACVYHLPLFLNNLRTGVDTYGEIDILCRLHAFFFVAQWTVVHFMIACIGGVHLLTFARIHYDQLFGLSPRYPHLGPGEHEEWKWVSRRECGQFRPYVHEYFEKFKIISTPTDS